MGYLLSAFFFATCGKLLLTHFFAGPDWQNNPDGLGSNSNFGSKVDRHKKKGSPVVPGSLIKVMDDNDSILYTVTVLRSMYEVRERESSGGSSDTHTPHQIIFWCINDFLNLLLCLSIYILNFLLSLSLPPSHPIKNKAGYYEGTEFIAGTQIDLLASFAKVLRDKRYSVRETFVYDPSLQGKGAMAIEQLQVEVDNMRSGLTRWCKTHYGEAFVAWMHIKVIRVFVESVLRYGLPVDFTAVLYKVGHGKEPILIAALDKTFGEKKNSKEEDVEDEEEYHDFVLIKLDP